ncbi:MAG: hypothetical protein K0Q49_968 [Haloplasmataceae bacterium]|jgi:lactoylglutathione lyase|nr:hypothetical protein [Haloplasmataceae bacterium]
MGFKGLAHIGIYTSDICKTKQFYMDYFDFKFVNEVVLEKPNNITLKIAFLDLNGLVLEILESSDQSVSRKGSGGSIEHFAIRVEHLDLIVNDLKTKGLVFETEKPLQNEKLNAKMIFLRGVSEERIELFEYL